MKVYQCDFVAMQICYGAGLTRVKLCYNAPTGMHLLTGVAGADNFNVYPGETVLQLRDALNQVTVTRSNSRG